MKHNEVKAYFKKKLCNELTGYDILSVDETLSSRTLYIVDKETLRTKIMVKCWFATNDYHITCFYINKKHLKGDKINQYKDFFIDVKGNYTQLHNLSLIIEEIKNKLI